jgi:signal transduction histidine kinase
MSPYDKRRKRILKRACVGLSLFILSAGLLGLASIFLGRTFPFLTETNPLVWISLATLVVALGYPPVDQAYTWLFRQILFPRRPRLVFVLKRLAQELSFTSDLGELANLLVNTLGEVLELKAVSLLVRVPKGEGYRIASAFGWKVTDYRRVRLLLDNPLLELLRAAGPQVLLREKVVRSLSWQEANKLTCHFETLRTNCIIPLWVRDELVGSVNLLVSSADSYPDEGDVLCFKHFGDEVAKSVRSALVIEELLRLNEELKDAQSQLLQSAKTTAIEQLATGIAHEIHNPLTIISGKAQVLLLQKDRKAYDEKVEEVLKTIVQQTRRAADITRRLLMFSRASQSPREKLRVETVLEDTLSLIAYQMSLEGIEIKKFIGQELPDFFGNVQELREVFLNLLLNAVQAIGPGGKIQVGITFSKADRLFTVQVADNGPGIAREHLDKVFNPFFTTRPGGVGLGLFVTQQIIRHYGGSIRAESEPGEGTIFVIELPCPEGSAARGAGFSRNPDPSGFTAPSPEGKPVA